MLPVKSSALQRNKLPSSVVNLSGISPAIYIYPGKVGGKLVRIVSILLLTEKKNYGASDRLSSPSVWNPLPSQEYSLSHFPFRGSPWQAFPPLLYLPFSCNMLSPHYIDTKSSPKCNRSTNQELLNLFLPSGISFFSIFLFYLLLIIMCLSSSRFRFSFYFSFVFFLL